MRRYNEKSAWWMVALVCSFVSLTACGDDAESQEADAGEEPSRAGRGGRAGAGGRAGSESEDDAGTAGNAGAAGTAGKGASGGDSCFEGEPKQTVDYLNRCTESECEPFDNEVRLPLLDGDKRPALP